MKHPLHARPLRTALAVLGLIWAGPLHAQTALPSPGGSVLQAMLGLAVVIALILGSLWLLKRLSTRGGAGPGVLQVVAGVAVGPRERVVLVEVADTWLVLGVAPGQVSALHQLPRIERPAGAPANETSQGFRPWLEKALERSRAPR